MAPYMNHFKFLQTISILYVLVTVTCTVTPQSHDQECSALFLFKQSIIHQDDAACAAHGSIVFNSWNTSFDCCSWEGVACSHEHEHGHVIGLDLSESSLCGHINSNSSLFSLVHLQRLNLSGNYFGESQIPSQIARLKQLRSLDLSSSGFSGQIPNGVSQLLKLTSLDLSGNPLRLHDPSLKNLVQNLSGLEELHLSGVDISSPVPHFLANFSSLRSIQLRDCLLRNEFPAAILELPKLQVLDLAYNTNLNGSLPEFHKSSLLEEVILFSTAFFGIVPESIGHLKHMRVLFLGNCTFSGRIPHSLSNLTQLTQLSLAVNDFTGLVPSLVSLSKLEVLDLSNNKFEKGSFPNWLGKLTKLGVLHLAVMNINGEIPGFLANLTKLNTIAIGGNSLTGRIPSWLFNLTQLTILDLQQNQLQGPIPNTFSNFKSLEYLNLGINNFSGRTELDMFLGLNKLQTLFLSYNRISLVASNNYTNTTLPDLVDLGLSSCNLKIFPSFLRFQNKLRALLLDNNKIDGLVPVWIWNNSRETLEVINLGVNSITGFDQHPHFLANLTKLNMIVMRENLLTGRIPSWLFNLTQLTHLDLQKNQLQGPIPNTFSNFKSLEYLDLGTNHFSGRVEIDMFLRLNKLQTLSLSYNRISLVASNNYTNTTLPELDQLELASCNLKEFPAFLRFQNKLSTLLLDKNKIDGLVPVWIWNNSRETLELINLGVNSITGFDQHPHFLSWRNLEAFFIDNNQLQGQLPIPLQNIVVYHVSYNNLTGQIPASICELKSLRMLDLSFNNMSGTLPSCLGILSNSLTSLFLRRNNFHGTMMNAFMPGCMLQGLDLSENRFTGQLPKSLTNCTNLEILTLGDNSFDDAFPFWLGSLANLQVLVLRSNKLYGPIQGSTTGSSQFPKLRIIDISNNSFSGQLHQNYFQTWHAMSSDNFGVSSSIKSDIYSKTVHTNVTYTVTLIHKGVMTEYEKILTINIFIDLSCNKFEGEIPQSLQDLQGIQSLNLSNNHFTGRILPSLGNLKNLEALDLSQNELYGDIPPQLVQLGFLAIFNVSFNLLEGHIPQGKQFNTFDNDSYMGNLRLCGQPLSKKCQDSKVSIIPPTSNVSESLLPSERIDWIIIFCGVGSGLAVGIGIGNFLYTRYSDQFTKRKDRWVRPFRNTRRN